MATWQRSGRQPGGTLQLDGRRYVLLADLVSRTCALVGSGGLRIASADSVGRREWAIHAAGTTYRFRRVAPWRRKETMVVDGRRVGSLRRRNAWRGDAVADLPGVPLDVEAFALAVLLLQWDAGAAV